jgi:prepilin-type processing-associated H-X9-DG protein
MEQQPLYDQFDQTLAAVDQFSPQNVQLIRTPIPTFICPSAPGSPTAREYVGSMALDAATDPSLAAFAGITWRAAPSDYMATEVIDDSYRELGTNQNLPDGEGVLQEHMNLPGVTVGANRRSNFANVTDGTAHTFIVGERTGGNAIYNGTRVANLAPIAAALGISEADIIGGNGGGWGDILNGENDFHGSLHSGIDATLSAGPCAVNCTNAREFSFHSFHPGGAMFVMADGSVQFITETVNPLSFSARFTRNGGETISD